MLGVFVNNIIQPPPTLCGKFFKYHIVMEVLKEEFQEKYLLPRSLVIALHCCTLWSLFSDSLQHEKILILITTLLSPSRISDWNQFWPLDCVKINLIHLSHISPLNIWTLLLNLFNIFLYETKDTLHMDHTSTFWDFPTLPLCQLPWEHQSANVLQ